MKNSFFRDLFNKKSDVVEEAKDPSKIFKALKIIVRALEDACDKHFEKTFG